MIVSLLSSIAMKLLRFICSRLTPTIIYLFIYSTGTGRSFVRSAPVFCSTQSQIFRNGGTRIRLARTMTTSKLQFKNLKKKKKNKHQQPKVSKLKCLTLIHRFCTRRRQQQKKIAQ